MREVPDLACSGSSGSCRECALTRHCTSIYSPKEVNRTSLLFSRFRVDPAVLVNW